MRFVVFKGTAGWGDRLQCLLQVIRYAKATQRYLVMDWRDVEWAHNGRENFDDFLHIKGIKVMQFQAFLDFYQEADWLSDIYPKVWREHMHDHDFKDWLYKPLFCTAEHGRLFDQIATFQKEDFDNQVVVYAGTGFRAFAYADFAHIRLNRWLSTQIKDYAQKYQLGKGKFDVIHLRGGSKKWAGGHVALESLAKQIDTQFPDLTIYLKTVYDRHITNQNKHKEKLPLYILSDSKWLAQQWINTFKCGQFLDHSFNASMMGSGIHEATAQHLEQTGTSKYRVNTETLRDFAVMLNAREVSHDGVSLFSALSGPCSKFADEGWCFSA